MIDYKGELGFDDGQTDVQTMLVVKSLSRLKICKLLILYFKKRNETYQREYYKHCMKSKTPNVLLCPNKGMFKYGNENQKNITRILK